MSDLGFCLLGIVAAILSVSHFEEAGRRRGIRPASIAWAMVAAFLVAEHFAWLWDSGGMLRLSGISLLVLALNPFILFFWYGFNGGLRRGAGRIFGVMSLTAVFTFLWVRTLPLAEAVWAAMATALVPFVPFKEITWRLGQWRRSHAQRRHERREATRLARAERQATKEQASVVRWKREKKMLDRTLKKQDERLLAIERGERQERDRLISLRGEVRKQVRLLRQMEAERIRAGNDGLRAHEHYGFLMAEAWRVLRREIQDGERPAGIESDVFFFQVIDELTEADDFERRYLHESGREIMVALDQYIAGNVSLAHVRQVMAEEALTLDMMAPVPIGGGDLVTGLLESWLVPHRSHQVREWELYLTGEHPRTDVLNEFFDDREIDLPTREQWIELWDENPRIFGGDG